MPVTSLKSEVEKLSWAAEDLRVPVLRGRGGPPVAFRHLAAPVSAHLSPTGVLSWKWHSESVSGDQVVRCKHPHKVLPTLCERFAALADASDEEIRLFAERWGPLRYRTDAASETETRDEWRRYAKLARALVRCTVALSQHRSGLPEDWLVICAWLESLPENKPTYIYGIYLVSSALNRWYARSDGNALVEVQKNKIVIRPGSGFLFGIIGMQLAFRITGAQDTLVCYHCHQFYTPKNKPRTGARTFCPACRRAKKPEMYAMRDHRARQI